MNNFHQLKSVSVQMNSFLLMKTCFCGRIDSLSNSTYQIRDPFISFLVFVKKVIICRINMFTWEANRLQLPKSFKKALLQTGQYRSLREENLLEICYHDKKNIYFLSTIYRMEEKQSGKPDKEGRPIKMLGLQQKYGGGG